MVKLQTGIIEIFVLALLWGPSFLFNKISLDDIPPLTLVALRISIGALLLLFILKFNKIRLPNHLKLWKQCFIIGLFANGLPFICFNFSLLYIPSSLSAVINGATPIITIILANIFLKDEHLNWSRIVGVLMGLCGFVSLFLPALLKTSFEFDLMGMLLSLIGSCSYAVAIVYARKHIQGNSTLVMPTIQLLTSLSYLIPLAFVFETPLQAISRASLIAWGGVLGLAILGTVLAFILYYRVIARQGATAVAMVAYLLPVVGTILGVVFLNEKISLQFVIAALLILSGVLIANKVIPLPFVKGKKVEYLPG